MRLWTVHPRYLDSKGLVALWREGLLAKAVLEGNTRGYRRHPQLIRFRAHDHPSEALCDYLRFVLAESQTRGYRFDAKKLPSQAFGVERIEESQGQLEYEWRHLLKKFRIRDPDHFRRLSVVMQPEPHPLFSIVPGSIRNWENEI